MQYFSTNFKLGILGGGQLGKMLLSECAKFDIYCIVLDPNELTIPFLTFSLHVTFGKPQGLGVA